ncbi:MAG: hypothetical protein U0V64_16150, partial [Cyclobacteriaceae bacterium]
MALILKNLRSSQNIDGLFAIALGALACTFLAPQKWVNLATGLVLLVWIKALIQGSLSANPTERLGLFLILGLFLLQVAGLAYSEELPAGLRIIETKSSFLIACLILTIKLDRIKIRAVMLFFALAITAGCLWCQTIGIKQIIDLDEPYSYFLVNYRYQSTYLTAPLDISPIYFSLFVGLSILLIREFIDFSRPTRSALLLIWLAYLFIFLILLGTRTIFLSFTIIFTLTTIPRVSRKWRMLTGISLVAAFAFVLVYLVTKTHLADRYLSFLNPDSFTNAPVGPNISNYFHFWSWKCAANSMHGFTWITGVGTGDENLVLNRCYVVSGVPQMAEGNFNAHSEYLSELLRHGLPGLALLLSALILPLIHILRRHRINWLYVS